MLDQITGVVASLTGDGGYGQDSGSAAAAKRHPDAAIIVPPPCRATRPRPRLRGEIAISSMSNRKVRRTSPNTAAWRGERRPATRRGHEPRPQSAASSRCLAMSGEPLGSTCCARAAEPRAAEVDVAVHALNRMMGLGRPNCVRTARPQTGLGLLPPLFRSMQHLWTPPSGQGKTSGWSWHVVGCCHLSGLWCSGGPPRACMGVRGPGPNHARVLEVTVLQPGCPDPVSPTVAPCLPSARPTPSWL